MRYIPESEYVSLCDKFLQDLAHDIAFSGLSISEIAKGTRLRWPTVYNASQGVAVRMENAIRIRHFLSEYRKTQER